MSSSEQRRASSCDERRDVGAGAQDLPVDELHHVERRVVDGDVVAETERGRDRDGSGRQRGQHLVLAGHVVRGRQHVAERRAPQYPVAVPVVDRVGEVRAAAGDQRRRQLAAGRTVDVRGEPRSQPFEIDTGRRVRHGPEVTYLRARRSGSATRCGTRGGDGLAVAPRVTGDAADRHVDAESRGGALFFGLGAPEAVLPVLAGPVAAFLQRGARVAHGPGLRLAHDPRFRSLAGRARRTDASGPGRRLPWSKSRDR